jgi:hypothetical protein
VATIRVPALQGTPAIGRRQTPSARPQPVYAEVVRAKPSLETLLQELKHLRRSQAVAAPREPLFASAERIEIRRAADSRARRLRA